MLEYHAAYYQIEDGWYLAKVLDFPGAVSQGRSLKSAQRMIRDSLRGLAQFIVEKGEVLPKPNPKAKDDAATFNEKILLKVRFEAGKLHEKAKTARTHSKSRVPL
jgi:predicted RNase H-like HicB family nuclease